MSLGSSTVTGYILDSYTKYVPFAITYSILSICLGLLFSVHDHWQIKPVNDETTMTKNDNINLTLMDLNHLSELKKLLDDGIITQEEFDKSKQRILTVNGVLKTFDSLDPK